ncbi:MAG: diguanylate cyclase, partial [Alphaproteobacteria bacterium]
MSFLQRGRFWILLAVLLMGFCGASTFALLEMRRDTYGTAIANADNLRGVLSQDIEGNLRNYDRVLSGVAAKLTGGRIASLAPDLQQAYLFEGVLVDPYFTSLLVLDAAGNVVRDAGADPHRSDNFSDRDYFQVQRDGKVEGIYFSDPFRRRLTGDDVVIALSRRIDSADG